MQLTSLTHNLNTMSWVANILSTDNYITYEQVTQSVSIVWVQYYLPDRFIKYLFYSLTFGDIWIQFIAIFIYFEILMNYLHTNVHISEFSKKCVYFNPFFVDLEEPSYQLNQPLCLSFNASSSDFL